MALAAENTLEAISSASRAKDPAIVDISPLQDHGAEAGRHQVLFFVKPEITSCPRADLGLAIIDDALRRSGVVVVATRVLNGHYLAGHKIVEYHYVVINRLCRFCFGCCRS